MALPTEANTQLAHDFHDSSIYGFELVQPVPELGKWESKIKLDIDYIQEWVKCADSFKFLVSKAELCFENVSDLKVSFSFPETTITSLPIDRIERSKQPALQRSPDYTEFGWKILLNDRSDGFLELRATGYHLIFFGEPILCEDQYIPLTMRSDM
ncbi:MAG: hypothetical protein ACR2O3_14955 [Rhizobiaceae bacterium]